MKIISPSHIFASTKFALVAATAAAITFALVYVTIEPSITHSQEVFTIQATVTGESAFLVPPSDVTMVGTLNGLTGGQATGTTQFVVQSNSTGGYEVQMSFENNGSGEAMLGDLTADTSLRDYGGDSAGEPSKGYVASTAAQFAYTVTSSTTSDTDPSFFHDGTASCNDALQTSQATTCWKAPSTANFKIADRNSPATTGATSTIMFNVTIPNSVTPVPSAETYTATATLSLINT
jgi:hypothetical protein